MLKPPGLLASWRWQVPTDYTKKVGAKHTATISSKAVMKTIKADALAGVYTDFGQPGRTVREGLEPEETASLFTALTV